MSMILPALLIGCTKKEYSTFKQSTIAGFDTTYAYGETSLDDQKAKEHYDESVSLLQHYNDLFDIYNDYKDLNNLKTINDQAGIAPVKVEQPIIDLLKTAKQFYDLSNGEFDITIGAILKVWHEYRENGIALNEEGKLAPIPTQAELEEVSGCRGWDKITIDETNSTVYIHDPCVSLDVGGIAKGYATELVAQALEKQGTTAAFLNVGRNIRTIGDKVDGTDWKIGISDPDGKLPSGIVAMQQAGSFSYVTSGDYERYYVGEDGKVYCHIIDPKTLFPATHYRSVTIITKDSGIADCLSTTLFTLSIAEGEAVLENYRKATNQSVEAVWIMDPNMKQDVTGEMVDQYFVHYSSGLQGKINTLN